MPITFESVSFSYEAPTKPRKKERFLAQAKSASETEQAAPESSEGRSSSHSWGNTSGSIWALKDVSLTINDGEFFGIAGHTGSGKSTLIQHMNGLINPTEGRVLVGDIDMSDKKAAAQSRSSIGLVMQYPEHQLFASTVFEDIAFGPKNLGLSPEEVEERVKKACQRTLLDYNLIKDKSPFALSGGQQRRVAIAGVLAMSPEILVLDEPAAGLDPHARTELISLIKDLHARGLTVVLVSHDMDGLAQLCDRILVLNQGMTYLLGSPEDVFSDPDRLARVGLGVPLAQRFADALRAQGIALEPGLYDEDSLTTSIASLYTTASRPS